MEMPKYSEIAPPKLVIRVSGLYLALSTTRVELLVS